MANSGSGAPLSRREPGAARPGPGQSAKPVLSESVLSRMKAAIDAEHAQAEQVRQDDPNTEPLPRVTVSGPPSRRGAKRAPSPSGAGPETDELADQATEPELAANQPLSPSGADPETEELPERAAKPGRAARPSRSEEPLRVVKALRAVEPDWPHGAGPTQPSPAQPAPRMKLASAADLAPAAELSPPADPPPPAEAASVAELAPPVEPPPPPEPAVWAGLAEPVPPPAWAALAEPEAPLASARPASASVPRTAGRDETWPPSTSPTTQAEPTPGSIGWLWPDETATGGRGRGGGRWRPPGRWRYRTAALVAAAAVVLAAAGVYIGMSLHSTPVAGTGNGKPSSGTTAPSTGTSGSAGTNSGAASPDLAPSITAAASWIKQQVAVGTGVACDAQTCAALTAAGFPAGKEVQIGLNSQSFSGADVIVLTPQLRTFLKSVNSGLANEVAPAVLARFGLVSVQVIAPHGAAAYETALRQDVQARIQLGQQLLSSGRLTAAPTAGTELSSGHVDARVLLLLQALSDQQPIDVLAFTDSGPGASPGVPYRAVDLAISDPSAGMNSGQYFSSLHTMLLDHAHFPAYTSITPTTVSGQTAAQIEYAAPAQLGMLSS
jgi:hypothetical protein